MYGKIYIVAGNYAEFKSYVSKKEPHTVEYVYVSSPYTILGLTDIKGFYIGTYNRRDDIEKIKNLIYIIKCKNEIIGKSFENE
jgi:hypothetical protein